MEKPMEFEIKRVYADLRKSEQKAADWYLAYDGPLEDLSLASFAEAAGVSQPTVIRFLRALGLDGFKEFKCQMLKRIGMPRTLEKASETGSFPPPLVYGYAISEKDCPEEVPGRVVAQAASYLDDTLKHISPTRLSEAAALIRSARRIGVYYVENSVSIAQDLATKLLYLGFQCVTYDDFYLQQVSANNLGPGDVAIGISYSGCSRNTVDVMKLAKRRGAATIVLTNFEKSIISRYADVLLCTCNRQLLYGNAIFSRTSQIAVVDMLYMRIILEDYEHYTRKLEENSRILRGQAYLKKNL